MIDLSKYRKIHCIGIGGIGLSAIAEILLSRGYSVSGSDMKESDITDRLRQTGAIIYLEHVAENVEGADLVVYSAAIAEENPEMVRAKELGIPTASRAEILGFLMDEYPNSIAISGTHGKTTTTSMVSVILEKNKLEPTILVGGYLSEIDGNYKVGDGSFFVTEACEYRDSFLSLRPYIEVILNIDSDHLDYFKDIEHIVRSFDSFAKNIKPGGNIIAYDANPFINRIIKDIEGAITYGYNPSCTYAISDVKFDTNGMPSFNISYRGEPQGTMELSVPGEHNILNATAAFACCHQLGVASVDIIRELKLYTGTKRRFDIIGKAKDGVTVVDDYAHHPTEIKATLSAAQNLMHNKIWCLFQPHTYTRTLALFDDFIDSFKGADILVLTDIYAAREKDIYNISSDKLAERIKLAHPEIEVVYIKDFDEIASKVLAEAERDDLVITMGAGDIYKVGQIILEKGQA